MSDKQDTQTSEDAAGTVATPDASEGSAASSTGRGKAVTRAAVEAAVERGIENWRRAHLSNSPVSRATPALNYLTQKAVPELAAMIMKEI